MVVRRFQTLAGMMGQSAAGRTRRGERSWPKWRSLNLVQKVFGFCTATSGTKMDESMLAGEYVCQRVWENDTTNLNTPRGKGSCQESRGWQTEKRKRRSPGRSAKGFGRSLRWEISWAQNGLWNIAKSKYYCVGCGSTQKIRMPGRCEGRRSMGNNFNHKLNMWGNAQFKEHDVDGWTRMARPWRGAGSARDMRGAAWGRC